MQIHKKYLWNQFGLRLQWMRAQAGEALNWLFLPGGPGLGSESLYELTECLNLPGNLWCIDLPGDGSNTTPHPAEAFKNWPSALEDVVDAFANVILVGHSTGGMYALSLPSLEEKLLGLILIDSAPDASWQSDHTSTMTQSNAELKALTVAAAPGLFTEKGLLKGTAVLEKLPYNCDTCNWSAQHFDATYRALWVPQRVPTLILGGSEDRLTPLSPFKSSQAFHRDNILIKDIPNAGHFPWIDNPQEVAKAFDDYLVSFAMTRRVSK